jgi:hypothetical protein
VQPDADPDAVALAVGNVESVTVSYADPHCISDADGKPVLDPKCDSFVVTDAHLLLVCDAEPDAFCEPVCDGITDWYRDRKPGVDPEPDCNSIIDSHADCLGHTNAVAVTEWDAGRDTECFRYAVPVCEPDGDGDPFADTDADSDAVAQSDRVV